MTNLSDTTYPPLERHAAHRHDEPYRRLGESLSSSGKKDPDTPLPSLFCPAARPAGRATVARHLALQSWSGWRKSRHSITTNCVQVQLFGGMVLLGDTKHPTGVFLRIRPRLWATFLADLRAHRFDLDALRSAAKSTDGEEFHRNREALDVLENSQAPGWGDMARIWARFAPRFAKDQLAQWVLDVEDVPVRGVGELEDDVTGVTHRVEAAPVRNDMHRDVGPTGDFPNPSSLPRHHGLAPDDSMQHGFVQEEMHLGGVGPVEHFLTFHSKIDQRIDLVLLRSIAFLHRDDGPGVVFRLQKPGNHDRFEVANDRRRGLVAEHSDQLCGCHAPVTIPPGPAARVSR
ncbi:DUF397 domain-containing protein [Cryptosporangium phraense]|uniref:DUF397 domain-containing protein n=1 Tax=Cryptosporangium phraense TaxID=2593070 RepID=A0A545AQZ1_9ACTN|nr:DUF397 domain-containing protein [Cryptosporangium phraense]